MKKKQSKLQELQIKAGRARVLYEEALEQETMTKTLPALRKTVGKHFKYINSYGGSYERWPLYVKVLSIDEKTCTYTALEFQRTSMEIVEVKLDKKYNFRGENYFRNQNYIPITSAEYNRAKKALLKFMQKKLEL